MSTSDGGTLNFTLYVHVIIIKKIDTDIIRLDTESACLITLPNHKLIETIYTAPIRPMIILIYLLNFVSISCSIL